MQLSARLSLCPSASSQAQAIGLQIQQLQNGEVFHSHVTLQAQQQLQELMSSAAPLEESSSTNAEAVPASSDIGFSRAALSTPSDAGSAVESAPHPPLLHASAELDNNFVAKEEMAEFQAALSLSLDNDGFSSGCGGNQQNTADHQSNTNDGDVSAMSSDSILHGDAPRTVEQSAVVESRCRIDVPEIHLRSETDASAFNAAAPVHVDRFSSPLMHDSSTAALSLDHSSIISSVSLPLASSIGATAAPSLSRIVHSPSHASFTYVNDVAVPSEYVSWNEFQRINKGLNRKRVSEVYRATPWFKENAKEFKPQVRLLVAPAHLFSFNHQELTCAQKDQVQMSWNNFQKFLKGRSTEVRLPDALVYFQTLAHSSTSQDISRLWQDYRRGCSSIDVNMKASVQLNCSADVYACTSSTAICNIVVSE